MIPTSPSAAQVSIRKKITDRKRRRARQLLDRLRPLQKAYPEFKTIIAGSIEDLKDEAKRNPESDRQRVLSAIHLGVWTISDLLDELPLINRKALQVILNQMAAARIIITKVPETRGDKGGRVDTLYLPAPNSR